MSHDPSAEAAILGSIMWNNSRFHEAADIVRMEHFYLDSNRRIYHRVAGMISAGRPVDIITLVDELTHHHELDAIGGRAYLASLTEGITAKSPYSRAREDRQTARATQNAGFSGRAAFVGGCGSRH